MVSLQFHTGIIYSTLHEKLLTIKGPALRVKVGVFIILIQANIERLAGIEM